MWKEALSSRAKSCTATSTLGIGRTRVTLELSGGITGNVGAPQLFVAKKPKNTPAPSTLTSTTMTAGITRFGSGSMLSVMGACQRGGPRRGSISLSRG